VRLHEWLLKEDGQDVVEYSLLLAFVVIVSAALFLYNSQSVVAIWTSTNDGLGDGVNVLH
jgi:Flp pilus assembly pilin Flp